MGRIIGGCFVYLLIVYLAFLGSRLAKLQAPRTCEDNLLCSNSTIRVGIHIIEGDELVPNAVDASAVARIRVAAIYNEGRETTRCLI